MILGHCHTQQGYIGHVNVKVAAVYYHGEEVGILFKQNFVLYGSVRILLRAHYHILIEGYLYHTQRIFGFFSVQGQAERKRKSELHTALRRVNAVVFIKRFEYEVETVCVGKSAVYKTEAVDKVAYTEHAARQGYVHVQIERDVAEQAHQAVRKRSAVAQIYFRILVFLCDFLYLVGYLRVTADVQRRAQGVHVVGICIRLTFRKRARAHFYVKVERAVHKQQAAFRFHKVYCVSEQRVRQLFEHSGMRVERHAQVFESDHLNEVAHQGAGSQFVHGERRSGADFFHALLNGRIFYIYKFAQIGVDAGEQLVQLRIYQIGYCGIGDFYHSAAQRAVPYGGQIHIDLALYKVDARNGFPNYAARRHFYADVYADLGQIRAFAVQHKVEPVLHIL